MEIGKDDQSWYVGPMSRYVVLYENMGSGTYLGVAVRDGKTVCPGAQVLELIHPCGLVYP